MNIWNSLGLALWLKLVGPTVDKFKLWLDQCLMYQDIKYDFTAELTATGDRSECVIECYYSVSQKNTPDIFSCNLNKYFPISIIFGTSIT